MLKKISFYGFKSFADKVEVEFSQGITAVIGPNGCGKSNIFDGVRWVLGEQSAKSLRGGKMDDVIFSGSEARKARDFAEVTLVLDNTTGIFKREENEVSVTRRATRGKGSEYFINGESARMKDVHDLFLDTGVGSNSYSIIGQGQIEKILSTKLEERRAIFEEASGIVKLKQQKEQTEKRLGEVDTNLIRIEDILKEIEKQLKPLREQSAKAKEYKELADELQTIETQYLLHEYDQIQTKIVDNSSVSIELETNVSTYTSSLEEKETLLENAKGIYQSKNDEIFEYQSSVSGTKEEAGKIEGMINLSSERMENANRQIKEIDDQLKEIEDKYSLSTEDFKTKQRRLDDIEKTLGANNKELDKINQELNTLESEKLTLSTEIQFTRDRSIEEYNALNQEKFELDQLTQKEEESDLFLNGVSGKMEAALSEKTNIAFEFEQAEKSYKDTYGNLQKLQESFNSKNTELKDIQDEQFTVNKNLQDSESDLIRKKSQLESIENFIENNENFFEGVKAILQEKKDGKFTGVHGAVAELIKVNKKYEVAIDTLLQSAMQFLVTEDDKVAQEAVNYLKKGKLGRATFLPLNMASPSSFDKTEIGKIEKAKGISLAIEAVTFDEAFEPIVSSLLGRTIIADDLETAIDFVKKSKVRAKVATIDGETVQSGSISGGQSKKQKTSYFTKRREMEELKASVEELSERVVSLNEKKTELENRFVALSAEVSALSETVETEKENTLEKQRYMEDVERKLEYHTEKVQELEVQEKEVKLSLSSLRKTIMNLRFSIESKEKSHKELTDKLDTVSKQMETNDVKTESLKEKKTNLMLETNRLADESKSVKEFLDEFSSDSGSVEDKINRLYERKESEEKKVVDTENDRNELTKQFKELSAKMKEENDVLEKMKADTKQLVQEIDSLEKEIKEIRGLKEKCEKDFNQKQVYLSRKETEKANILNRLQETYEITEEMIADMKRIEIDLSSSKKEIDRIKRKINGLGNINHQAIEDCENLETRYKTEKEQFDDVKQAKNDLLGLLKTVEDEMMSRFGETFGAIAKNFEQIFVDLFGGGKAKLTLLDEKDPLNSAIEIIAQPPGKKPQSINLLSGGEKAFTAVALIFSIITAKPSPFVIFDEVDAPLDDANVARYARYTKEYSKKCQFIIVTHRKFAA